MLPAFTWADSVSSSENVCFRTSTVFRLRVVFGISLFFSACSTSSKNLGRSFRLCGLGISTGRSINVYISFETTSVSKPIERANRSVSSKIGRRISPKPNVAKTSCAVCSTRFHSAVSGGRMSRVPLMAWNLRGLAVPFPGSFCGALAEPSLTRCAPCLGFRESKNRFLAPLGMTSV